MNDKIIKIVRQIIELLLAGEFQKIAEITHGIRMNTNEIERAIRDYGRTLINPPEDAFHEMDIVEVKDVSPPQFSVRIPLWTKEEGRSDLTLELTLKISSEKVEVELDDLRVL